MTYAKVVVPRPCPWSKTRSPLTERPFRPPKFESRDRQNTTAFDNESGPAVRDCVATPTWSENGNSLKEEREGEPSRCSA